MKHTKGLPTGWTIRRLGDVVSFSTRPRGQSFSDEVPFLPMALISEEGTDISKYEMRPPAKARNGTYFREGDLLIARITPASRMASTDSSLRYPGGGVWQPRKFMQSSHPSSTHAY